MAEATLDLVEDPERGGSGEPGQQPRGVRAERCIGERAIPRTEADGAPVRWPPIPPGQAFRQGVRTVSEGIVVVRDPIEGLAGLRERLERQTLRPAFHEGIASPYQDEISNDAHAVVHEPPQVLRGFGAAVLGDLGDLDPGQEAVAFRQVQAAGRIPGVRGHRGQRRAPARIAEARVGGRVEQRPADEVCLEPSQVEPVPGPRLWEASRTPETWRQRAPS